MAESSPQPGDVFVATDAHGNWSTVLHFVMDDARKGWGVFRDDAGQVYRCRLASLSRPMCGTGFPAGQNPNRDRNRLSE